MIKNMRKTVDKKLVVALIVNLVIAFLAFIGFIVSNGGLLTLSHDYNAQEIVFNLFANRSIKEGNVFFNWAIDMGSDFTSSFSFYNLGSPFFWITLLFSPEMVPYVMPWVFMAKYAVAGGTAYLYLREYVKDGRMAVAGSVLYAFCGYQATNIVFYHFHDVVAFFPLLLLGIDKIVLHKKYGMFAFAVGINALVNWNFFVGEVIFAVIYFCFRMDVLQYLKNKNWKTLLGTIMHCIMEGILGIGIAAAVFVPSVYAILFSSRISNHILGSEALAFSTRDYLLFIKALLFPTEVLGSQSVLDEGNWYSIAAYLPMIGIIFVVVYMLTRKRNWISNLLWVSLVIAMIPGLNNMFTLFNEEPYRRWYYMPVLIMVLASTLILEEVTHNELLRKKVIRIALVIAFVAFLFFMYIEDYQWSDDKWKAIYDNKQFLIYVFIGVAGIVCTVLIVGFAGNKKYFYSLFLSAVSIFAFINLFANICVSRDNADWDTSEEIYSYLNKSTETLEADILPYRYSISNSYYNRNLMHSMTTIDSFISTVDAGISDFYINMGLYRHTSSPDGPEGTNELLSVKYHITDNNWIDGCYVVDNNGVNDIYLFEEPYALPIGFTYDSYITQREFYDLPYEERAKAMLRTLVVTGEDEEKVAATLTHYELKDDFTYENKVRDITLHQQEASKEFTCSTTGFRSVIETDSAKYAFFSVPYSKRWSAVVNGKKVDVINVNALMAVPVEAGNNIIEFKYDITINIVCMIISIVSTVIALILLIINGKRNRAGDAGLSINDDLSKEFEDGIGTVQS